MPKIAARTHWQRFFKYVTEAIICFVAFGIAVVPCGIVEALLNLHDPTTQTFVYLFHAGMIMHFAKFLWQLAGNPS
jgi:hypothetical protein